MKKTLIFDLDGTLLDSLADIAVSMNEVLREFGLPEFKQEAYGYFVGGGIDVLVDNVQKALSEPMDFNKVYERFKAVYEGKMQSHTKPYEGVENLLKNLKSHNLAVLSNKPHKMTNIYVNRFFPNTFSHIYGQRDGIPKKPNPNTVFEIINELNATYEHTYFIGDTNVDMQTAKNAKITSIGVLWGFRDEKELKENGANFIVKKPSEILDIVNLEALL